MQRAELVLIRAHERFLRRTRLGENGLGLVIDECVQFRIQAFDAIKVSLGYFYWRNFFAADLGCEFDCGRKLSA